MPTAMRDSFASGTWTFDGRAREARNNGKIVSLGEAEFSVLSQLLGRPNQVVLRADFIAWGREALPGDRHPVDMVVVKLRRLLKNDFEIETIRGAGYRLKPRKTIRRILSPTSPESDLLGEIAADRMKMHSARSLQVSVRHYEEVLKSGPDELAYCELVKALINLGHTGLSVRYPHDTFPRVRAILHEALTHFPESASAYALRGLASAIYDFDWQHAYEDVVRAAELDPKNHWAHCFRGHIDIAQGKYESGIEAARLGARLDPTTPMTNFAVPMMLYLAERPEEAASEAARQLQLFDPFPIGNVIHGYALSALGLYQRAIAEFKLSLRVDFFPDAVARLGYICGVIGDREKALAYLQELRDAEASGTIAYLSGYLEALIWIGLEDFDKAMTCLENSLRQRCDWLIYLNAEPCWKKLRKYDRFKALSLKVGIEPRE
jgi:DNA-binding winged helix-turn-helix (wHTH) protein